MARIYEVTTKAQKRHFIEYPYKHYKNNDYWVPPLRVAEWDRFNPKKNPFFDHARVKLFLAKQDSEVVGRIAGIDNDSHNLTHNENLAFFGFFEAKNKEVAAQLLESVELWAKSLGRDGMRGPVNFSMDDGAGFQIDAFDTSPYIMMPYNAAEYPKYAEASGYTKVKDLYAWLFDFEIGKESYQRLERLAQRVEKRYQPTIHPTNMKDFDNEVKKLKYIYEHAWEKNWGFVKYTDAEMQHLANDLKMIIEPQMALFIKIKDELAGVAVAIPNIHQVFKRMNGRLLPLGIIHLLRRKSYVNTARLSILGLLPEYRHKGLELVLIKEIANRARAKGYIGGECSWVLEDNEAMNKGIKASGAQLYKTYRIYQKTF